MDPTKRIIVNTTVQYLKAVINTLLSLYTVRLILSALGQEDYGIYSLVAGIVSMLGFLTNAMVITTQRYLSFHYGSNNKEMVRKLFSNSLILHFFLGLIIAGVLLLFRDFLCQDFLNIADDRRNAAGYVYIFVVGMLFLSLVTAPFKAFFIARENIVFISVIEVIDGVLKLLLALSLLSLQADKLMLYAYMMTFIYVFEFCCYSGYALIKYPECCITHIRNDYNLKILRDIGGFASWTTYGSGAIMLRTQGLSVLINKFFGTIVNASYGIALQLNWAVSFISTSICNAMNPQIMKAEGEGNRERMLCLAEKESKYVVAIMSLLFIPAILEMENILRFWLHTTPPLYSTFLCQCMLISFLVDQLTYGLNAANQAIGNIKVYSILMYTPKMLFIFFAWILLYYDCGITPVMFLYIAIELVVSIARLPYLHRVAGLNISKFIRNVFLALLPLIVIESIVALLVIYYVTTPIRPIFTFLCSAGIGAVVMFFITITPNERQLFFNLISHKH